MSTYLLTGTSRGIGLGLLTHLSLQPPSRVSLIVATYRTPTAALTSLISSSSGRIHGIQVDVTDPSSVANAAAETARILSENGKSGLDVLVNNAGAMTFFPEGIKSMDMEGLEYMLRVNVTSTQIVTSAFMGLLEKGEGRKVVNVSSTLGSIAMASNFAAHPAPGYKIAKAALNMLTVQWALEYAAKGFTFLTISPGWVKTDLGGSSADLTMDEAIPAVADIIFNTSSKDNGKFLNIRVPGWEEAEGMNRYDGEEPPW